MSAAGFPQNEPVSGPQAINFSAEVTKKITLYRGEVDEDERNDLIRPWCILYALNETIKKLGPGKFFDRLIRMMDIENEGNGLRSLLRAFIIICVNAPSEDSSKIEKFKARLEKNFLKKIVDLNSRNLEYIAEKIKIPWLKEFISSYARKIALSSYANLLVRTRHPVEAKESKEQQLEAAEKKKKAEEAKKLKEEEAKKKADEDAKRLAEIEILEQQRKQKEAEAKAKEAEDKKRKEFEEKQKQIKQAKAEAEQIRREKKKKDDEEKRKRKEAERAQKKKEEDQKKEEEQKKKEEKEKKEKEEKEKKKEVEEQRAKRKKAAADKRSKERAERKRNRKEQEQEEQKRKEKEAREKAEKEKAEKEKAQQEKIKKEEAEAKAKEAKAKQLKAETEAKEKAKLEEERQAKEKAKRTEEEKSKLEETKKAEQQLQLKKQQSPAVQELGHLSPVVQVAPSSPISHAPQAAPVTPAISASPASKETPIVARPISHASGGPLALPCMRGWPFKYISALENEYASAYARELKRLSALYENKAGEIFRCAGIYAYQLGKEQKNQLLELKRQHDKELSKLKTEMEGRQSFFESQLLMARGFAVSLSMPAAPSSAAPSWSPPMFMSPYFQQPQPQQWSQPYVGSVVVSTPPTPYFFPSPYCFPGSMQAQQQAAYFAMMQQQYWQQQQYAMIASGSVSVSQPPFYPADSAAAALTGEMYYSQPEAVEAPALPVDSNEAGSQEASAFNSGSIAVESGGSSRVVSAAVAAGFFAPPVDVGANRADVKAAAPPAGQVDSKIDAAESKEVKKAMASPSPS
ncbi:MAG: hypothetical protein M1561_04675 [Gammaproteobacteria bacterium]|nr:hypothetical protein [Gammaproteobacteria bacterium]